ncbi:MAG: Smr/MutS family protein [Candidatus Dormibacterales bacterium]
MSARHPILRKVDIAHSGQSAPEAIDQLVGAIKNAERAGEEALLVVHGFGASGVGGIIKDAVVAELPRLARAYRFKVYGDADKARVPRELNIDPRWINQGAALLVFRSRTTNRDSERDFRPNFRNLKRIRVPAPAAASGQKLGMCGHANRQLLSHGPSGSTYRCRSCGGTFLVYS